MAILVKIQIGEIANHSTDRILDESLRSWRARWRVLRPAGHPTSNCARQRMGEAALVGGGIAKARIALITELPEGLPMLCPGRFLGRFRWRFFS
jgi:hypothetical protein